MAGRLFEIFRTRHALDPTTPADSIVIDVPAGQVLTIHGVEAVGGDSAGVASAELGVYNVSTVASGGSPASDDLKALDGGSVPSGFTARHGFTTPATLDGSPVAHVAFQPYGGVGVWPIVPGVTATFWKSTAYQVAVRGINANGTDNPNVSLKLQVELTPGF